MVNQMKKCKNVTSNKLNNTNLVRILQLVGKKSAGTFNPELITCQ